MRKGDDMTAEKAANRLFVIFAWLLALFTERGRRPTYQPVYVAPARPVERRRERMSEKMGVPARYVDIALRNGGLVPFDVLFGHVRAGGKTRKDAYTVLKARVPAAVDFLDHCEKWENDSLVSKTFVSGDEHSTLDRLLHAAVEWRQEKEDVEKAKGMKYDFAALVECETTAYRPR